MTTNRPYRHGMDEQTAITELHRCAGTQFDPIVIEHFIHALNTRETRIPRAA